MSSPTSSPRGAPGNPHCCSLTIPTAVVSRVARTAAPGTNASRCVARLAALALSLAFGCGPYLPADYVQHSTEAREAYGRGEYEAAARHWRAAHAAASSKRYRDEARYREAVSLQRAGRHAEARAIFEAMSGVKGERQARAAFDAAHALLDSGDVQRGKEQLRAALLTHPNSGPAVRAAGELLDWAREAGGDAQELALARELAAQLRGTEVHQLLMYSQAESLRRMGEARAALQTYRSLIDAYPYPLGRYWDESILASARLAVELNQPQHAVKLLRWQLDHREQAEFVGSYDRHYAKAHFLLATITRDELHDLVAAREEFRAVAERYDESLLQDDALWQAMSCSVQLRQQAEACDDARRLLQQHPESRYAPCVDRVCPKLRAAGECHPYLLGDHSVEARRASAP